MRRWPVVILVWASIGLGASLTGLIIVRSRMRTAAALTPDQGLSGLRVPEFSLIDQRGAGVTERDFAGRVTVIDFFFTNCPFVCPGMTEAMAGLARSLSGTPVQFVSFSVDPGHDTAERLREYAGRHGADARWRFLTGEQGQVDTIVAGTLGMELQADPERPIGLPDGSKMSNIMHPKKLILIGPDRRVLGMYDPDLPGEMKQLEGRARLAARRR